MMASSAARETITYDEYRKVCPLVRLLRTVKTHGGDWFNAGSILIVTIDYGGGSVDLLDVYAINAPAMRGRRVEILHGGSIDAASPAVKTRRRQ